MFKNYFYIPVFMSQLISNCEIYKIDSYFKKDFKRSGLSFRFQILEPII